MAGGNSVGVGKSTVDLSKGVGISIRVSRPLAQMMIVGAYGVQSSVSSVSSKSSVSSVGRDISVGNISGVVGMAGGNSVGVGKSTVDLSKGVGISIRVSGPLAQKMMAIVGAYGVQSSVSSVSGKSTVSTISMTS